MNEHPSSPHHAPNNYKMEKGFVSVGQSNKYGSSLALKESEHIHNRLVARMAESLQLSTTLIEFDPLKVFSTAADNFKDDVELK